MKINLAEVRAIEKIEDRNIKVFRAALMYSDQGIPVIPIPYGEKHVNNKSIYTSRCSARREKVTEWFHPETGTYKGYNVALGCGDYYGKGGIFAVDVDNKYDKKYGDDLWGPAAWSALSEDHGCVDGPVQQTPSGGEHVLTLWKENLTPSQNRIAKGIDTRGGHKGKVSSHIMAFPSVVDGKEYQWKHGGEVRECPAWIEQAMGISWRREDGPGRGNEGMKADDVETQVSLMKVLGLLEALDPNVLDYEDWVKVGQAIHSQHSGGDGLDLWDEWSQKGERYESGECHVRWKGFKANGPVRMATLFYMVQQYGTPSMVPEDQGGTEDGFVVDCIDEYNRRFALVLSGENVKVARKEQVLGSIQYRYKLYAIDAFRSFFSNDVIMVQNEKGAEKPIRKFDIWMGSPRRNSFDGMLLKPDMDRVVIDGGGLKFLNTWAGFAVTAAEGRWDLMKQHIFDNLCCGNEEHYEWLMDWMADMFQEPSDPKGCAVVLGGIEGAGKGTLANAIAKIFGLHASIISNAKHLQSQFNAMIMDSVFLFADEVVYAGNHEAASLLKAMVTEKTNTREQKFGAMEKVDSYLHIMMATNNDWKVAAGPESRRWFVLKVKEDVANSREYFGAIKHQMENGGYEAMLHELLHRDVLANLRYAPVTKELKVQRTMMQVQSLYDSLPAWVAYLLDTGNLGMHDVAAEMHDEGAGWPSRVEKSALWESYAEWSRKYKSKVQIFSSSVFFPKIAALGFEEGPRITRKSGRIRTIDVPSLDKLAELARKVYAIETTNEEGDVNEKG